MKTSFSHEIRYARDLFDQRFDTQGRSMVLINHTETIDNTPFANVHNLELALRRIAERMNLEEDVVFIFLKLAWLEGSQVLKSWRCSPAGGTATPGPPPAALSPEKIML